MGNSSSKSSSSHLREPLPNNQACERIFVEDEFLSLFRPKLVTLGKALWQRFASGTAPDRSISTDQCREIARVLEKSDNKLSFFLDLLAPDQRDSQFEAFLCLLQWFRLGCTISDDLFRAIREAINQVGQEAYNTEALQSRLLSLFPDIADDLTRATAYVLNNPIAAPFWESIRPLPQYTNLMTEGVYWLLSQVLSSPFKRFSGTALTASAPLEIEQLIHLQLMYDSKTHGFSLTRIKECAFDFAGPILILLKTEEYMFCIAIDDGLRDTCIPYGGLQSRLFRVLPDFAKLISGRSKSVDPKSNTGIVYSNFTAKMSPLGLYVGHRPPASPALEVIEDFTKIKFMGSSPMKLTAVEIWAAGTEKQLLELNAHKKWEENLVKREKNRKFKLDEQDWKNSADRSLLDMAGVNVRRGEALEPTSKR